MQIKSEYEKRIEAYIESNDCSTGQAQRIEIAGKIKSLPIYSLPIKMLVFNVKNGRFAADLENLELALRKKLSAWKPEHAKKIKQILLGKSAHDTRMFKEDLKKRGQLDPGVITSAGVVINANRRMAIFLELYEETTQDKYNFLETSILPHGTSEIEIYKIEARLQYAKDFKQPFGAVNELLKIEEGLKHMSKRELAALLVRDEKYIHEHIAQLSLLRLYSKFVWKKVDYKKIEELGITEQITDVEKNIRKFKAEGRRPTEIAKLLRVQFAYMKCGCVYRDIRAFGKAVSLSGTVKPYLEALAELEKKKISEQSFQETITDISDASQGVIKEKKQVDLVNNILRNIQIFQDKQFKITPEIKEKFVKISEIITKLIKQRR